MKQYYLISIAFWLQQCLVLNIEEKRKDHYQMFCHHIITVALMLSSYYYYFNRIGNLILMIMDSVDIFFSTAKVLKYAGFHTLCDIMFYFFFVSWIALRHVFYNYLFYVTWAKSGELMKESRCIPGVEPFRRCWTPGIMNWFLTLLGGLQIITLIWMYLIAKVAYKVVTGSAAEDVRSGEEDTDDEEKSDESVEDKSDDSANTLGDFDEKEG